jgi:hypothetical protein
MPLFAYQYSPARLVGFADEVGGEREKDNRLRALRAARAHTVGFIGGCDQEQGKIKYFCNVLRGSMPLFAYHHARV